MSLPGARWVALLKRNPDFARLWFAEAVSLVGDWFSVVAILSLAATEGSGEGAWAVAVTLAVHELPMGLVRPIGGLLADRFDRRNLLVGLHLGQALLTVAMAERALARDIPSLQVLVFLRATISGVDAPTRSGAMRRLVQTDDLLTANALGGVSWSAMFAVGMALGGVVASVGVPLALLIDSLTFLGAAALLLTLPRIPTRGADAGLYTVLRQAFADWREAFRQTASDVELFRAVTSKAPLGLAGGAGGVFLNLVAANFPFAGTAALSFGILQAVRGTGIGVGPLVAERALQRGRPRLTIWRLTALCGFVGLAVIGTTAYWPIFLLGTFVWGMGTGSNWMLSSSHLQRHADDQAVGRLAGFDMLLVECCFAASALAAGAVVEATHRPGTAIATGLVLGGVGFTTVQWIAYRRPSRVTTS